MADAYHQDPGYGPPPGDYGGYGHDPSGYGPPPAGYGSYAPDQGYAGEHYEYDPRYDQAGPPGQDVMLPGQDPLSQSYQQYTESNKGGGTPGGGAIDPETGIAPRRCTDCVCLLIFLLYVLGMVILVTYTRVHSIGGRAYGDIRRLTHGHDYKGRLCGVDPGVEDKPFLFFCRDDPLPMGDGPVPKGLNYQYPACVPTCPSVPAPNQTQIKCLTAESIQSEKVGEAPFGITSTFHVQFQQSEVLTNPYDSVAFGGRYCVPTDNAMKEKLLHGPLRFQRFFFSPVGSFEDPWTVLFMSSLLAIVLGYIYVFMIKLMPRIFVVSFLYITWALFTVAGGFFAYAVVSLVVQQTGNEALLTKMKFEEYKEYNPLYESYTPESATILSVVVAGLLWLFACGTLGTITHVAGRGFHYVPDLVDAASECWGAMQSMLVPPGIEAIFKYLLTMILAYNFMYLLSVGTYDDTLLEVNGKMYRIETAQYHFDFSILPWVLYYIFGWVWIMELTTSCGQFLISFSVISWYFMKKEGHRKTGTPPTPALHGTIDGILYHAGSLCLGASIIPWIRVIRMFNWVEDESVPNEEAACCNSEEGCISTSLNAICRCIGGLCSKVTSARKACTPACCSTSPEPRTEGLLNAGCAYRYTKNGYNDVIIRSQHYLQASQRAFRLIHKYDSTRTYLLEGRGCQVLTAVGVISIGVICMIFTYTTIMDSGALTNPESSSFIPEPIIVSLMAFLLCGNIGYSFMMLFDHTSDTLLYCYAWNKKFAKDVGGCPVEDYLPESLRDIVDADLEEDDAYIFYGQARPEMYLHTWLPSRRKQMKAQRQEDKERQTSIQTGTSTMGAAASAMGSAMGTGQYGYAPASQVPYQAVATGGYTPSGTQGYTYAGQR